MPELEAGSEDEEPDDELSLDGLDSEVEALVSDDADESDPALELLLLEDFDA